jgi:methyl acetate hydrolase
MDLIGKVLNDAVAAGDVASVAAGGTNAERTLFQTSAGTTLRGGEQAVDADTVFWIASMTKPVTSVAAMQLVEAGRLSLDAPIGDWLPELAKPRILENGKLRAAKKQITLRHLLTHTAGFSYPFTSAEYAAYIAALPAPPVMGTRAALDAPLLFEPGERWEYGLSTDWVGLAVEAASGETLDAYFKKHIFAPLGMEDTSFLPDEDQQARRAAIHQRQADGSLTPSPPKPPQRPEIFSGGGGLFSSLNDYQKFLRMFLASGGGVISPETVAEMSRNQIGDLRAGRLPSVDPAFMNGSDAAPGIDAKWGLGFMIHPVPGPLGRHAGSLSWAGAANTYFWIDPAAGLAAVILMQILPSGDAGAIKTYGRFEKAVYAASR